MNRTLRGITLVLAFALGGCRRCEPKPNVDPPAIVDAAVPPAVDASTKVDAGVRPPGPWPSVEVYCQAHPDGCVIADLPDPDMKTVKVTADGYITTWLALRTAAGWWAESVMLVHDEERTGFTNPTVTIEVLRVERPERGLPFVLVQRSWWEESPTNGKLFLEAGRDVRACRFEGGYPDCSERHVLADISGPPSVLAWDAGKPTIAPSKTYTVDDSGQIVVK